MRKVRKLTALLLAAATMASLSACGGGDSNGGSSESKSKTAANEIIMAEQPENGEYDPAGATAYVYFDYQTYCLEGLVRYAEDGSIIPAAASTWESNDDATEWTFHLREDGKWNDGSQVTSADFLNTITRALDPETGSWYVDGLFVIKGAEEAFNNDGNTEGLGVECPDDLTIKFTLKEPTANFLDLLSLPVYFPSNSKYAKSEDPEWDMDTTKNLCNGPFYFAERKAGVSITFKKNENYYDANKINIEKVTYKFMNDDQAKVAAYETGELDALGSAPYYVADTYAGKSDLKQSSVLVTNYILFNINMEPFDDVKVRQAFALAVNRTDITTAIGAQSYIPSTTFVAKRYKSKVDGSEWGDVQETLLDENLEKAKELLKEAGYENGEGLPEITYTYPAMSYEAEVAQVLQAQWKELGVDVKLQAMEYEVYVDERRSGKLQLARHQWTGDYGDPATWLDMYREGNSQNDIKWVNEEYNSIMAESAKELDAAKRQELLLKAEKILVSDETVICPLFTTDSLYLINPDITGLKQYSTGGFDFRYITKKAAE